MNDCLTGGNGIAEAIKKQKGIFYHSKMSHRVKELIALAKSHGVSCRSVSERDIDVKVGHLDHRGYLLEIRHDEKNSPVHTLAELFASAKNDSSLVIVLDGITDPGNLGAVIRSAENFSVDAVIVPKRRAAGRDADTLSRSSAGAIEWVSLIEVTNISRTIKELKDNGYWVWGADKNGEPIHRLKFKGRSAFVIGREGRGLHRLVGECCDGLVGIPTSGNIDSLNAATAAGILMYEVRRQQGRHPLN